MVTQLRNGSTTFDRRLDRLVQFDERSKNYPIRAIIQPPKPRSYTWKCDGWLDQGQDGACVGFSWAQELLGKPSVNVVDNTFAKQKIYWEAQKIDEYPGGEYPGATPISGGSSVLAGAKVVQGYGYMSEYRWAFGLDDLIMAVGHAGPAVLGINWYENMFSPDSKGVVKVGGPVAGGHAILCNGVDISNKFFRLHNSWGKSWAINGECLVSFDDMGRLLSEQGEAVIPVGRKVLQSKR